MNKLFISRLLLLMPWFLLSGSKAMNYRAITQFFMWNTVINGCILVFWPLFFLAAQSFIYEMHSKLFFLTKENFNNLIYLLLGIFKLLFFVFNVVPFFALLILKRHKENIS